MIWVSKIEGDIECDKCTVSHPYTLQYEHVILLEDLNDKDILKEVQLDIMTSSGAISDWFVNSMGDTFCPYCK